MDMKKVLMTWVLLSVVGSGMAQQGSDNFPKEGSMFYMENGKTRTIKASTRADSNVKWSFNSVVEKCFDKKSVGKNAWLMTADGETQLKVTFEYDTDDERYNIEASAIEFYFYEGKDLFNDENKELISDTLITGTFTKEEKGKTVTIHLRAPQAYPYPDKPWHTFYMVLYLKFKGLGGAAVARQIGVSRNGLFLLHGLNSSRECFFPFREYLLQTAQNYFVNQLYLGDYSSTNTSSFYANTHENDVVKNGLLKLSDNLLLAGIASTKYDMVGHSMGGILERLYIQEVDDKHTNRLITLNTPHYGSILGNVFLKYEQFLDEHPGVELYHGVEKFNEILENAFSKDRSMQAVRDLAKNSPAMKKLESNSYMTLGIPVCAVGSEVENWEGLKIAIRESFYSSLFKLYSCLYDKKPGQGKSYLDKEAEKGSDYVVSVESQKGGCDKSYIYKGHYFKAMHCKVTEWDVIHEELNNLLSATETYGLFTTGGFGDIPDPTRTRAEEDDIEFITGFEEPKPTSFIKIEAKKVDGQDYTHEIKLTNSDDMMTKVAFCLLSPDDMIADYEKDVMYFDMSGFEGEKWIYAFGRTNYNALVIDSVKVTLGGSGGPDGIKSVENDAELRYTIAGNILTIKNVTGPYSVAVYNYAGQMLTEMNSNPSHTYALPYRKGLLIIGIRSNKDERFIKVVTKH